MITKPMMQQTIDRMLARAASDAAFNALCWSHPEEAFSAVAGEPLPEGIRLRFVPVRPGDLLVPLASPREGGGLEDKELDMIVGGADATSRSNHHLGEWLEQVQAEQHGPQIDPIEWEFRQGPR
jgi:hypothetical protein